jgi:hypothetical protein
MRWAVAALLASALLAGPRPAEAYSGFLKAPAAGYVKLSFSTISSDRFYDTEGDLFDFGSKFTQRNVLLYGEVGVLPYLTVGVNTPVLRLNSFETSDTAAGFGDLTVFLKSGLELASLHLAAIASAELPTGRSEYQVDTEFEGIRSNLPTGDGEADFWFRLAVSRSLPTPDWLPAYASAYTGYNLRTRFAGQVDVGGELGVSILGWVWLQGSISALFTTAATEDLDPTGIFLFGEGTQYVAAGFSASAHVPSTPLWVTFDVRDTFANLRNLYAGTTFGVGLAADW